MAFFLDLDWYSHSTLSASFISKVRTGTASSLSCNKYYTSKAAMFLNTVYMLANYTAYGHDERSEHPVLD
jgi:hypothetical protein